jgi:hypothetical protein
MRTFSIFAGAMAFQIFLVVAIADLPQQPDFTCGAAAPRATLAERLGVQDMPELYEVFGLADEPPPKANPTPEFGCIQI